MKLFNNAAFLESMKQKLSLYYMFLFHHTITFSNENLGEFIGQNAQMKIFSCVDHSP